MLSLTRKLVILNFFLLQSYLLRFKIAGYPSNLQEILIAVLAIVFTVATIKRKKLLSTIKNLPKYFIIISFILLSFISLSSVEPLNNIDFYRYLKFLLFAIVLVFISLETFETNSERKHLIKITGIGALCFGIFSVIYNLAGYNVAPDYRLLGPLDAAVYLAYYLTPFLIFFTIEAIENSNKKSNILISILLGILLIATRSMGAIGAGILILGFYIFKRSNLQILKKRTSKIIILLIITATLVGTFYSKILPTIKYENSSLDERGEIWKVSFELLENPKTVLLGLGPNQFQEHYFQNVDKVLGKQPLDYYVLQPHNIFLSFIFNYGILGLIFLLVIIILTLKTAFKIKEKANINQIASLILCYFLIHGLIDTPFLKNDLLILLILFSQIFIKNTALLCSSSSKTLT